MADENTETTVSDDFIDDKQQTGSQTVDDTSEETTAVPSDGVLDLRPAAGSVKTELLRLGMTYERTDPDTGAEIWRDYARHLMAEFPNDAGEPVTLTDLRTGIARRLTRDQLTDVTRIIVSGEEQS